MISFLFKRLLETVPTLIGVSLLTFVLFYIAGGDPAFRIAGNHATVEQVRTLRAELGTDQPLYRQYVNFLRQIVFFDFGTSWATETNVSKMMFLSLGPTLCLTLPAYALAILISLFFALKITIPKNKNLDSFFLMAAYSLMSISFLILIMSFQYLFAFKFNWFPIEGWNEGWIERWSYLALPIGIYTVALIPSNFLLFRSMSFEESNKGYILTAKSKGLTISRLTFFHILRNLLGPIVILISHQIPFLFLGVLLLESFFGIPGLGGHLFSAISDADLPVIKAITIFGSLIYILSNIFGDFLSSILDPRVEIQ